MLVSLWIPSLLGIGLHFWQIAGVPLVLLLMAWMLVPAWTANRLMARRTFVGLGATFVAVALLIAGGLWYRVAEVPDLPDQWDMPAFVAGIPSPEENKAGQIIRSACTKIGTRERSLRRPQPNPPNSAAREHVLHKRRMYPSAAGRKISRNWPRGWMRCSRIIGSRIWRRFPTCLSESLRIPDG